ncbi:ATP-grasp domain-containing protein [uncultured Akkermansia sp.]|uniref:ATP-grasp domain-containing protein n=1 Tax=uncultured Akkermansia sp. TaxID=512294 RepID=UPI0025F40E28|nr:ATP-grasp domain-containing protein [uncultured Akkermansia sp.]
MNPDFIIYGSGNYNSLGVLHCMASKGIKVFLLLIGSGRNFFKGEVIRFSKFSHNLHVVHDEEEGLRWLLSHRRNFPKGTIIYPTSDTAESLLDLHYDELIDHFIFPNAGEAGKVTQLMEKDKQTLYAAQAGIRTLWSRYTTSSDFEPDQVTYPCMVKPIKSITGSKGDMRVCHTPEELNKAIQSAKNTKDFIVQQYICNESDLLFLGIRFADGTISIPAVIKKPGVSSTGEYTYAIVSTAVAECLPEQENVKNYVNALQFVGPFSIEFGLEKDKNYFFEINLRNDGTSHYPLAAGINIPYIWYLSSKGILTNDDLAHPDTEYEMIDEILDIRRVLSHEQTLLQWYRRLLSARAYRYYVSFDPLPTLMLLPMFLSHVFQKLIRSVIGTVKKTS